MDIKEIVEEIKLDLGADINSLGISDETIELKIKEAVRKISVYAPCIKSGFFSVESGRIEMPEGTLGVLQVLNQTSVTNTSGSVNLYQNDTDLFSVSRYLFNYNDLSDPFIFLMQKNQLKTIQGFISLQDWRYDSYQNILYVNNFGGKTLSLVYLSKFSDDMEDIRDVDVIQAVKEYALALCKIIEGQIRRKLQSAPGAIQMDGDALVSEGMSEKQRLDEWIPKRFQNLRFGLRV